MSVTNQIVSAPITITEVSNLLGAGTNDLGTLCKDDHINPWAKFKPFRCSEPFFDQDKDNTYTDRTTAMRNANNGLQPPTRRDSTAISSCFNDVWTYNKPRGSAYSEYFRLLDFNNYSHKDKPPMIAAGDISINIFWNAATSVQLSKSAGIVTQYALAYSDFRLLDDYPRLGILLQGDTLKYIKVYESIPQTVTELVIKLRALQFAVGETIRYALLATNHPVTEGFTSEIGTSSWYSLPCDINYPISGSIVFSDDIHLTLAINGARPSASQPWLYLTNCYGVMPSGGGDIYYFLPSQTYNFTMQVRFSFTNTGEEVTVRRSLFSVYLSQNLTLSTATPKLTPTAMYDETGTSVESITIAEGATVNIGFQLPAYIFTMDSRGQHQAIVQSGRRMAVNICLQYNGVQNPIVTQNFRICDN